MFKLLRRTLTTLIATVLIVYIVLVLAFRIPAVQQRLADAAAEQLTELLGAEVTLKRIDIGFLNRLTIDDLDVKDLDGGDMLRISRTSVSMEILPLINGRIIINAAQMFGVDAYLSKQTPESQFNFQFIIDALESKDKDKEPTPLDLHIGTFILRHANVSYDIKSKPHVADRLDVNHLRLSNTSMNVSLRELTDSTLNVGIKRLQTTEESSHINIRNLSLQLEADKHQALLKGLELLTDKSEIRIGDAFVNYESFGTKGKIDYNANIGESLITPSEFRYIVPALRDIDVPIRFSTNIDGTDQYVFAKNMAIVLGEDVAKINLDARVTGLKDIKPTMEFGVSKSHITSQALHQVAPLLSLGNDILDVADRLVFVDFDGKVESNEQLLIQGNIATALGNIAIDGKTSQVNGRNIQCALKTEKLDIATLVGNQQLGSVALDADVEANIDANKYIAGRIHANVPFVEYSGYSYNNTTLDGDFAYNPQDGGINLKNINFAIDDPNAKVRLDGAFAHDRSTSSADISLDVSVLNGDALHLQPLAGTNIYKFNASADITGHDLSSLQGTLIVDSVSVNHKGSHYGLKHASIESHPSARGRRIAMNSDFVDGWLDGDISYEDLPSCFINAVACHLPTLINQKPTARSHFDYALTLSQSPILRAFTADRLTMNEPIRISGTIDGRCNRIDMTIDAPDIVASGTHIEGLNLMMNGNAEMLAIEASGTQMSDKENVVNAKVTANVGHNKVNAVIDFDRGSDKSLSGNISLITSFFKREGKNITKIEFLPSTLNIKDSEWEIANSSVEFGGKGVEITGFTLSHEKQYVKMAGMVSENAEDAINVEMNDLDIAFITNLVNFHSVEFDGRVSGTARISDLFNKEPDLSAVVRLDQFKFSQGDLGTGNLHAWWDKDKGGIALRGQFVDKGGKDGHRITGIDGYISTVNKFIDLGIDTHDTNGAFLNSFIGGIFKDIEANINGNLHVIGPLSGINLIGDVTTDAALTLRPTNVRYQLSDEDTLRLRPNAFVFDDMRLYDDMRNIGLINGKVTHTNFKNFGYEFNLDAERLTCYKEEDYNSDKFCGYVLGTGDIHIKGADGHGLRINADIVPNKGSWFAYDAASPDGITKNSFVTFRKAEERNDTTHAVTEDVHQKYSSDIYMDINLHMNNDCQIRLKMGGEDDSYISTYGTGTLSAHYYNKGPFNLQGTYSINSGSYRLYLQDIIYRDLALQPGSSVVFNGNPFDAKLHLICWHTLNAVPLSDITSNIGYNKNTKVKVVCVLDITGQLGNMNFAFDLLLPNVNDETRQLVKSLISTDEEMNTQIIYLLGLGRFYTNEMARAAGENNSVQAMNSLLSSTISGQINQVLSNAIGKNSNWNFGTGLSTGEKGWEDLDVEGTLSGSLLNDRLLINGNFGYRDNAMKQQGNFIGDFDVKWRIFENGDLYLKAYNMNNDRYFTKATLNTQGIGINYQKDFDKWSDLIKFKKKKKKVKAKE